MSGKRLFLLSLILELGTPVSARADLRIRNDLVTTFDVFGYRPAKIVSDDAKPTDEKGRLEKDIPPEELAEEGKEFRPEGRFEAGTSDVKSRAEVRARFRVLGDWAHLHLDVYTIIPERKLMVNFAGIEFAGYFPVHERIRLGFYHHSSHNFSVERYGGGIDLDALVADAIVLRGDFEADGHAGEQELRAAIRYYTKRRGSPYLFTDQAVIAPGATGETVWRADLAYAMRHPRARSECTLTVVGGSANPASALLTGAFVINSGRSSFLGSLGEHLHAGPFIGVGKNFSRTAEFGDIVIYGGFRVDLLMADTPFSQKAVE